MRSQLRMRNRRGIDSAGNTELGMGEVFPDRPANIAPVLQNLAATVPAGGTVRVYPLRGATDDERIIPSTLYISTAPANGTARVMPDGSVFFDAHSPGSQTNVTFQYRVSDNRGALSNAATATITVTV